MATFDPGARFVAFSVAVVVAVLAGAAACHPDGATAPAESPDAASVPTGTPVGESYVLAQLTGEGSLNATDRRWQVTGTDLGITWDDGQGHVLLAFGDTFGQNGSACAGPGGDHRDNVLARSSDHQPDDGLLFDEMTTDRPGHAGPLTTGAHSACPPALSSCPDDGCELQRIPSGGVSIGGVSYLAFMSMRQWYPDRDAGLLPGDEVENFGGLLRSDDDGATWQEIEADREPCGSNFAQVNFVKDDGFVYIVGAPQGKHGPLYLGRAAPVSADFEDRAGWQYWDGASWQSSRAAAVPVVAPGVGEMSMVRHTHFGRFILAHRDKAREAIVWRAADAPTGPWSGEHLLLRSADSPLSCPLTDAQGATGSASVTNTVYGPMIHPWFVDGPSLYFNASQWVPYNVFSWRADLLAADVASVDLVSDPGFEEQTAAVIAAPWCALGGGGAAASVVGSAHQGSHALQLDVTSDPVSVAQTLAVPPNATLHVSAWIAASGGSARLSIFGGASAEAICPRALGAELGGLDVPAVDAGAYTQLEIDVPVGSETLVDLVVASAADAPSGSTVLVDDVNVTVTN